VGVGAADDCVRLKGAAEEYATGTNGIETLAKHSSYGGILRPRKPYRASLPASNVLTSE
jgi:hypothetical protein